MGLFFQYKCKTSIKLAAKEELNSDDAMLQHILKETKQPPVHLSVDELKPDLVDLTNPLPIRRGVMIAAGLIIFFGLILFFKRAGEPSANQLGIVPPIITDVTFSKNNSEVIFTVNDDTGINFQRLSILANDNQPIPYELLKNGQVRFKYPKSPVMVYVYDRDGHETRQQLSPGK